MHLDEMIEECEIASQTFTWKRSMSGEGRLFHGRDAFRESQSEAAFIHPNDSELTHIPPAPGECLHVLLYD